MENPQEKPRILYGYFLQTPFFEDLAIEDPNPNFKVLFNDLHKSQTYGTEGQVGCVIRPERPPGYGGRAA